MFNDSLYKVKNSLRFVSQLQIHLLSSKFFLKYWAQMKLRLQKKFKRLWSRPLGFGLEPPHLFQVPLTKWVLLCASTVATTSYWRPQNICKFHGEKAIILFVSFGLINCFLCVICVFSSSLVNKVQTFHWMKTLNIVIISPSQVSITWDLMWQRGLFNCNLMLKSHQDHFFKKLMKLSSAQQSRVRTLKDLQQGILTSW